MQSSFAVNCLGCLEFEQNKGHFKHCEQWAYFKTTIIQRKTKSKAIKMRPFTTMRGTSFGTDDGSIAERLQEPSMRPSTVRGCSFEDDNGVPEKPYDSQDNIIMPKGGLRPLTMRGTSFSDDDGGGVPKKPHKPVEETIKPKRSMRPSTVCGTSFGDDGGAGVPEKPQKPVQKPDKPKRGIRPSTVRRVAFGDDDGGGVPEKPQEPVHTFIKPNRSMRPSTIRGTSFGDDDGGGVPEKPHKPDHNFIKPNRSMRPATTRGASFGDDDGGGVPEKSQELDGRPSTIRGASGKSRLLESAPPANKGAFDLEKLRKGKTCYKWYVWMGHPNRAEMKRRVATTEGCDITVADVDDLPWMPGGKRLSLIEVNKMIIMK
jgi:hypothetical protein